MRYSKVEEDYHIYIEGGETEQQVLRAIVKASFELARPAGMGWLHFQDDTQMTDEIADKFVSLPPQYGNGVVNMDYVQGRQCKTHVRQVDGHFLLSGYIYERDRGTPEPLFERVKTILAGKTSQEPVSTSHMYRGESLTLRLKEYGYDRKPDENDWAFRKRVFPDLFTKDSGRAMEFLMGASMAEWHELDKIICLAFIVAGETKNQYELKRFADGFADDPLKMRTSHTN